MILKRFLRFDPDKALILPDLPVKYSYRVIKPVNIGYNWWRFGCTRVATVLLFHSCPVSPDVSCEPDKKSTSMAGGSMGFCGQKAYGCGAD
jgi:hypothetical protein